MRTTAFKIVRALMAVSLVLTLALAYHLYQVRSAKPDHSTLQISCIEVQHDLSPAQVKWMHQQLKTCPGWVSDHYSAAQHRWVFFHDNRQSSAQEIFNRLQYRSPWPLHLVKVSPAMASKKVCPAMADVNIF